MQGWRGKRAAEWVGEARAPRDEDSKPMGAGDGLEVNPQGWRSGAAGIPVGARSGPSCSIPQRGSE